jgi:uncharacterized protein
LSRIWTVGSFYIPRIGILGLLEDEIATSLRLDVGLFGLESSILRQIADYLSFPAQWKEILTENPTTAKPWAPVSVTFSNTQKCTLRCRYCYADGGRLEDTDIDLKIAKAAIDLIVTNAIASKKRPGLVFLGEGEATANWTGFCAIIDYFKRRCQDENLMPFVHLSTNGVFSPSKIDYVVTNCDQITFSIDGIAKAHDANRIFPNGEGSFSKVSKTLAEFDKRKKEYTIRTTGTVDAAAALSEFVRWVAEHTNFKEIHIEPVFNMHGVARTAETTAHPDVGQFTEAYRKARRIAARHGIQLYYSSADAKTKYSFCGASDASNFLVTSKGIVSSCNEVLRSDDKRAGIFQYGKWDECEGRFVFDVGAISKLGHLKVHEIPKCHGCFAKYNCAGDCYAKSMIANGDPWANGYTDRCYVTRELLKDNLAMELLRKTDEGPGG